MDRYDPLKIEQKWQKIWAETEAFKAGPLDEQKPKKYLAEMFPYPSGAGLHVGHVRNFTIVDVLARFYTQQEMNVLRPFGYDTFGLPAENYAIKTGISPQNATATNIANFRKQAQKLGYAIDWSREINTSDPEYYKWTQWCFLQLYKAGLAYQKESYQWWCPVDQTVLANEQVENGHCWRCGHEVEKKKMKQWFFKITAYADELLDGIDALDWPDKIKTMQKNWIGRSEGAEVGFQIARDERATSRSANAGNDEQTVGQSAGSGAAEHEDLARAARSVSEGRAMSGAASSTVIRHKTIKKVTEDIHRCSFNTAVAALMEFVNNIFAAPLEEDKVALAKLLKPFAPHLASEMLEKLGADDVWPTWDESALAADTVEVVIQVNGKLRGKLSVSPDLLGDADQLQALALAEGNVQKFIAGKEIRKVIVPKGAKLINIVV